MTENERNELKYAILMMWQEISVKDNSAEIFRAKLEYASDLQLAAIFIRYKKRLKEKKKTRTLSMYVSQSTYDKIVEILACSKMRPKTDDPTLQELLQMKQIDFQVTPGKIKDNMIPFFDVTSLLKATEEEQEKILALSLYYLFLKEAEELEPKEELEAVKRIHRFFVSSTDFYAQLYSTRAISWSEKTCEERLNDLEMMLLPYITRKEISIPSNRTKKQ